jgi:hypothetical protein
LRGSKGLNAYYDASNNQITQHSWFYYAVYNKFSTDSHYLCSCLKLLREKTHS